MESMFRNAAPNAEWSLDLSGWTVDLVISYDNFNELVETKVTSPNFK